MKEAKVKLQLPKRAKPSKQLHDDTRPSLSCAYVQEVDGKKILIATNSYGLVRIPVNDDMPVGPISAAALKRLEMGREFAMVDEGISITEKAGRMIFGAPTELVPNYDTKYSGFQNSSFKPEKGDTIAKVALNPSLLKLCADAMGCMDGVELHIRIEKDGEAQLAAFMVRPLSSMKDNESEGVLMPIRRRV